jgi:hypothetical protein
MALPGSGETPERKKLYHPSCPHGHFFHTTEELIRMRQQGWRDEPLAEPEERKKLYHKNAPAVHDGIRGVFFCGDGIAAAKEKGWQDVPIGEETQDPAGSAEVPEEFEKKERKKPGTRLPRRGE